MEKRIITVEQINKLLNYLAGKPFIEVHQLIAELQQLPQDSCIHSVKDAQCSGN